MSGGADTHYHTGEAIRAGDRVRFGGRPGVFVLGTGSFAPGYAPADWEYLGRGFMIDAEGWGLVLQDEADEDLELVARG